jgi:hypothetical protein
MFTTVPCLFRLVDILYDFLSANRISLGGALDGIIAAKRMEMSKEGKETCSGECSLQRPEKIIKVPCKPHVIPFFCGI